MKTRKLAQILAREVIYRSRRTGYKSFSFLKRDKVGAPSALKSNALGAIFFSIISLAIISPLFYANREEPTLKICLLNYPFS
ncbi:MAG: hypothetical protein DRJ44_05580 [Thermoprotei archaeon]|nr:MAG: hypothetical protein DRJ44_05580 [Thermoprotei archaeon]